MEEKVFIRSDDDAFAIIEKALNDNVAGAKIIIEGWPNFSLRFCGDDFDGNVTASIAKTIIELQNTINSIYCLCAYGDTNRRRLKAEEREALRIKVSISKGSTKFDLCELAKPIIERISNMEDQYIATVAVFGILACLTAYGIKKFIAKKDKEAEREFKLNMSKEETKRLEIFSNFAKKDKQTELMTEAADQLNESIFNTASIASSIEINGVELNSERIKSIQQKKRNSSRRTNLEGDFKVCAAENNGNFWTFSILRADGKLEEFHAKTDDGDLIDSLHKSLKTEEYVHLNIEATMFKNEIKEAWIYPGDELDIE